MNADLEDYHAKLMIVEQTILRSQDENERNELLALKDNLIELLALTSVTQDDEAQQKQQQSIAEIEQQSNDRVQSFLRQLSMKAQNIPEHSDEEERLELLKEKCEEILGEKCSAPFRHTWGAIVYHNAIISSIESLSWDNYDLKVKLKVLFINPTHREMVPCNYYLEGHCRYDDKTCHFSHGETVCANTLKGYTAPDFERLSRNCCVLAKLSNRIWCRGRVLHADFSEKKCRVRLEGVNKMQEQEMDIEFQDLLPISQDDDTLHDSCSDMDAESNEDCITPLVNVDVSKNLFTYDDLTHNLGEWEKYTKGIGSKLMARMGYIPGRGLGQNGRGIVTPVSAQVLPPRRSLDHCMALREAANGDEDLFSIEKKITKMQKRQEALNTKAYEKECQRTDVFSFLNNNILSSEREQISMTTPSQMQSNANNNVSLQKCSTKSLNVKSVRITNEIKHKQKEIFEMKKSLKRNVHSMKMCSEIERKLKMKLQELDVLKNEESCLEKEQTQRKSKEKLCVF